MTIRKTQLILTCVAVVFAVAGCGGGATDPTDTGVEIAAAAVELEGWRLDGEPMIYVGESLFELINGGAELYHQHGFVQALAAEYVDDDDRAIALEVFEMSDLDGTAAIYAAKTGGSGEPAAIGDEAAVESYYLNTRTGCFLITITGFSSDETTNQAIVELAHAAAARLVGLT